jgi:hypothetical protein
MDTARLLFRLNPVGSCGRQARRTTRITLAALLATSPPLWAATIIVDETTCTLVDAITAANTDSPVAGCPAGSGADTLELTTDVVLTEVNNNYLDLGDNVLPVVDSDITIEGDGFSISAWFPFYCARFFFVLESGTLRLNDTTLSPGDGAGQSEPLVPQPCALEGGGIRNRGSLILTDTMLLGNPGDGILSLQGSVVLTGCTLQGNGGAGISSSGSTSLTNAVVTDNQGVGISAFGELTMTRSTISGNLEHGVVVHGDMSMTMSTVSNHEVETNGAGIFCSSGGCMISNSTLSGNRAGGCVDDFDPHACDDYGFGGAIYGSDLAAFLIVNSTLANNYSERGGPIGWSASTSPPGLANSIVAGNMPEPCPGAIDDLGNNFSDGNCGPDISTISGLDPELADNGGPTRTHALLPGSVAVDAAGDCGLETDQRGSARPRDGDVDGEAACDVGAFELQPPVASEPDPASQGHWHRQCLGVPAGEGGIDPGRNGRGPSAPTEALFVEELMPCADLRLEDLGLYGTWTCDGIDAEPANDPCEKAEKQLTALILNVCSDRLQGDCEVDPSALGCLSTNLDDLMVEVAGYIQAGSCERAVNCAAAVNEGIGLVGGGENGLAETHSDTRAERRVGRNGRDKLKEYSHPLTPRPAS